ncbi:hypothetical protein HW555_004819 [Spodoptera exigua]|uniref:Alcohol dehydrogenase n=1 Tax=Spodoptera exigua TaxID=7107 RepID=A0A835L558_SPOEX|nr:hypothetical protein HW555_004819 [Spodoptera exigua]
MIKGVKPLAIVADLGTDEGVQKTAKETLQHFKRLDVLVNNAAVGARTSILHETDMKIFDDVFRIDVRGVYLLTKLLAPALIETKGNIINVSSVSATVVAVGSLPYGMAKAALDHFTRLISLELAPKGVRVNSISPGITVSNFVKRITGSTDEQYNTWLGEVSKQIPMGQPCVGDDIARMIVHIASEHSRLVTGTTVEVDGGLRFNTTFSSHLKGVKPLAIVADLGTDEGVQKTAKETLQHFKRLDVLVNNAAVGARTSILHETDMKIFDDVFRIDVRGVYLLTKLLAPALIETKGNIINVSSIAGTVVAVGSLPYGMAKAALDHFTRLVSLELAPKGVRVNTVSPGLTITNFLKNIIHCSDAEYQEWLEVAKKNVPMGQPCVGDDIARMIVHIASEHSRLVTGINVEVDGALRFNNLSNTLVTHKGVKPLAIVADLGTDEGVEKTAKETLDHFKRLDVLVNNAAIGVATYILHDTDMQLFDDVFRINVSEFVKRVTGFTQEQYVEFLKTFSKKIPMGEPCVGDDIARMVVHIASDHSRLVTGTVVEVDGAYRFSGPTPQSALNKIK